MRCIALGQAWEDAGGDVVFVSCCDSEGIKNRIRKEGFGLVELVASHPETQEDLATTLEVAGQAEAAWIVVDGYHFNLAYQRALRRAGLKLLLVDDYNHLPEYEADILLNQNIGAEEYKYHCNLDCRQLLGLRHVMIRREFRRIEPKNEYAESASHLLISMGGSDPDNVTLQVIKALGRFDSSDLYVKILIGSSNPHMESLRMAISGLDCRVEFLTATDDMPSLIQWADFAISAAGSTCWELALLGVPFATVILADNQKEVALKLQNEAGVSCLGWPDPEFQDRLAGYCDRAFYGQEKVLEKLREELSNLLDSWGVDRVLNKPASESGIVVKGKEFI